MEKVEIYMLAEYRVLVVGSFDMGHYRILVLVYFDDQKRSQGC